MRYFPFPEASDMKGSNVGHKDRQALALGPFPQRVPLTAHTSCHGKTHHSVIRRSLVPLMAAQLDNG